MSKLTLPFSKSLKSFLDFNCYNYELTHDGWNITIKYIHKDSIFNLGKDYALFCINHLIKY